MRIDKGKGGISGKGDALARRREGLCGACRGRCRGHRLQRVQIQMLGDERACAGKDCVKFGRFFGLHEAEVTLGQGDFRVAGQGAKDADPGGFHSGAHQRLMPGGGDAVQHDARQRHIRAHRGKAKRHGGGGLCLPADIQHQHHRPTHQGRDIGAGPAARLAGLGHAVKEAHGAFGKDQISAVSLRQHRGQPGLWHCPTVKVERSPPRGPRVKRRVDVIRPALEGLHRDAPRAQRRQEPQRHRGLARARGRGRDEQSGDHGVPSGKRGSVPTGR